MTEKVLYAINYVIFSVWMPCAKESTVNIHFCKEFTSLFNHTALSRDSSVLTEGAKKQVGSKGLLESPVKA